MDDSSLHLLSSSCLYFDLMFLMKLPAKWQSLTRPYYDTFLDPRWRPSLLTKKSDNIQTELLCWLVLHLYDRLSLSPIRPSTKTGIQWLLGHSNGIVRGLYHSHSCPAGAVALTRSFWLDQPSMETKHTYFHAHFSCYFLPCFRAQCSACQKRTNREKIKEKLNQKYDILWQSFPVLAN